MRVRRCGFVSVLLVGALAGCGAANVSPTGADAATTPTPMPAAAAAPVDLGQATYAFDFSDEDGNRFVGTGSFRGGATPVLKVRFDELRFEGDTIRDLTYLRADGTMYTRMDELIRMVPPLDGKWMRLSPAEARRAADEIVWLMFDRAGLSDPHQQRLLLDASPTTLVGPDTIDGVPTTHVTASPSLRDILASKVSEPIRHNLNDPSFTAADLDERSRMDAWVDEDGRVRKFEMTTPGDDAIVVRTTSSFDVSGISELAAPRRADVVDYTEITELGTLMRKIAAGTATREQVREAVRLRAKLDLDQEPSGSGSMAVSVAGTGTGARAT